MNLRVRLANTVSHNLNVTADNFTCTNNLVMLCGVCDILPSKYKCPACRKPYCSLPCWKNHKEECSSKPQTVKRPDSSVQVNGTKATYNYPTEDTVEPGKLKLLAGSKKLKDILSNPHVRSMLSQVDTSRDPAQAINNAMREPIFVEFADECMHLLEPWSREELREERLLN